MPNSLSGVTARAVSAAHGAHAIRAVFVDLDGTLLNRAHAISPYTAAVLNSLRTTCGDSVAFVVATGRPFNYVQMQLERNGLQADYIISSNGCRVYSGRGYTRLIERTIPPRTVERLLHVNVEAENGNPDGAVKTGDAAPPAIKTLSTSVFCDDVWYTNYRIDGLGSHYPPHIQPTVLPPHILASVHATREESVGPAAPAEAVAAAHKTNEEFFREVHMAFFYAPHENLLAAEKVLLTDPQLKEEVSYAFTTKNIIDIFPRSVDKSFAVKEVLKLLNVPLESSIAFGDGLNDKSMLQCVGRGFVMANALDELKAALPACEVILSNGEDGVARKLVELFDLNVQ